MWRARWIQEGQRLRCPYRGMGCGQFRERRRCVPTLGTVIGSYKSGVTRRIREVYQQPELRLLQGRYHDHIIRSEVDLNRIREYILTNPARW